MMFDAAGRERRDARLVGEFTVEQFLQRQPVHPHPMEPCMNQSLQIGPLSLPYSVLLALFAIALGRWVARWMAKAAGIEAEPTLTRMLFVGLFAARLAFVWQWHEQYFDAPLSILDIRDGGWEPTAGVVAALLFGLQRAQRQVGTRNLRSLQRSPRHGVMLGGFRIDVDYTSALPLLRCLAEWPNRPLAGFRESSSVNLRATCPPCARDAGDAQQAANRSEHRLRQSRRRLSSDCHFP